MKIKIEKKGIFEDIKSIIIGIIIALLLNKALGFILKTPTPVVAVMTGSMVHDATTPYRHYQFLMETFNYTREEIDSWPLKNGFNPGDVLVIVGVPENQLKVGDVIVFSKREYGNEMVKEYDIVHRIVYINQTGYIFTKGDHNQPIDPDCNLFKQPQQGCWQRTQIKGKAVFILPFLGWPKLILQNIIFIFTGGPR